MQMTTTRRQLLAGASAAMVAAPVIASAHGSDMSRSGPSAEASRLARKLFAAKPAPALSLAVARSSGVVWTEALGQANLELAVAATPQHAFRLGSVSKVLASTTVAKLVSRGVLDLNTRISHWLPDLPEHHRATTLRQLLTHQGGVRHYNPKDFDLFGPGGAVYMRPYPANRDILALFVDDPLIAPPGTSVVYSSYGYTLASMAIEVASGKDIRQLILSEIGQPFGLTSLDDDDPWKILPNRAAGYMGQMDIGLLYGGLPEPARPELTDGWANMPLSNPAYSWAGAGFLMTVSDTARFGAAMLDSPDSGITSAERELLFTPVTEASSSSPPLGLGWRIDTDGQNRRRWHHAGATPGGCYLLVVYPELDLAVAIAGNVMGMKLNVMKSASDLADIFG